MTRKRFRGPRWLSVVLAVAIVVATGTGSFWVTGFPLAPAAAAPASGPAALANFNTDRLQIPAERIHDGGPPKDGIPALTDPDTVPIADAHFLEPGDRVIGVEIGGETRAYPMKVLNWHEVVNDELGGVPIVVVYCPLCDSASVAERRIGGETLAFGVSGLLANSNVLFYDRTHDALWSQVGLRAVSGPHAGRSLDHRPWSVTSLEAWREAHPQSTVVSTDTGHPRNYQRNPYERYFRTDRLMFPVAHRDDRLDPKARVVGVRVGDIAKAYPLSAIRAAEGGKLADTLAGERLVLSSVDGGARVTAAPEKARIVHTFWFAWAAFHPETALAE